MSIQRGQWENHFYPRSPCGERRFGFCEGVFLLRISIHALLAESDPGKNLVNGICLIFLSTLSLRRATFNSRILFRLLIISIHALLAESDCITTTTICIASKFLSTLSLRRATQHFNNLPTKYVFLSTLSLRRATGRITNVLIGLRNFYPRSPCGERQQSQSLKVASLCISIHALLAESDSKSAQNSGALLRIWNKFYGDCIFMLTGKAVFYPFCPCFFHIFWCEGSGNFMIAFPSH